MQKGKTASAVVTADERDQIKRAAAREGRSVSNFIRRLLVEAGAIEPSADSPDQEAGQDGRAEG